MRINCIIIFLQSNLVIKEMLEISALVTFFQLIPDRIRTMRSPEKIINTKTSSSVKI